MRAALLALTLAAGPALALQTPQPSPEDPRMRTVVYDEADVVDLKLGVGIATRIVFEAGESVREFTRGDTEGIECSVLGSHLYCKPKAVDARSNLMVETNRRTYAFRLTLAKSQDTSTYQVRFRYPESEAAAVRERARAAVMASEFTRPHGTWNLRYSMAGDLDLAPVHAWDDGTQTFIKFPGNRDLPAVYQVDASGQEALVNSTTTGAANDTIVLHRVNARWMLRIGDRVLAIFNDAFDPVGVSNTTGTTSPGVQRVIKEK